MVLALSQSTPIELSSKKDLLEQLLLEDEQKDNAAETMAQGDDDVDGANDDLMYEMLEVMQNEDDERVFDWLKSKLPNVKEYINSKLTSYWNVALKKFTEQYGEPGNVDVPSFTELKNIAMCAPKVVVQLKNLPQDCTFCLQSPTEEAKVSGWNTLQSTVEDCMSDVKSVSQKCQQSMIMKGLQGAPFKKLFPPATTKVGLFVNAACALFERVDTMYDKTKSYIDDIKEKLGSGSGESNSDESE